MEHKSGQLIYVYYLRLEAAVPIFLRSQLILHVVSIQLFFQALLSYRLLWCLLLNFQAAFNLTFMLMTWISDCALSF